LSINIYDLSKNFPIEEKGSLTKQIRRSSRSVAANIGEAMETGVCLCFARDHNYISEQTHQNYFNKCNEIQKMLRAMINSPEKFTINN
jgi:hypothetical protein